MTFMFHYMTKTADPAMHTAQSLAEMQLDASSGSQGILENVRHELNRLAEALSQVHGLSAGCYDASNNLICSALLSDLHSTSH